MNRTKLKIITFLFFVIGTVVMLLGTEIYARMLPYHPDAVMTVYNENTHKNTHNHIHKLD